MQLKCSFMHKTNLVFICENEAVRCFGGTFLCSAHSKIFTDELKILKRRIEMANLKPVQYQKFGAPPDQILNDAQPGRVLKNVKYKY